MTNVQVQCCHCKGSGQMEVSAGDRTDWTAYRLVTCTTCNGFGVVIATELKAVTAWQQVKSRLPIDAKVKERT